jgi:uncharacterized repeat protein (TIGR03803 family)
MKAVFIALLAALIGSSFARPVLPANAGALKEEVLHSFCSQARCADGAMPAAGLIFVNGVFYGTTSSGGIGGRYYIVPFGGTAFSFEPNPGAESVLFTFCVEKSCAYGSQPAAGLTDVDGLLYGTTYWGGVTSPYCNITCGTAFSLDPETGAETLLYTFCSQPKCADGSGPFANLTAVEGMLYGTTIVGGAYGDGTLFVLR